MQVHAKTKSGAMKRGADKAIAKSIGVECCLSKMVGSLTLDALNGHDLKLLTEMYQHVFGYGDRRGSITVYDADGKEVVSYFYSPAAPTLTAKTDAPSSKKQSPPKEEETFLETGKQ